MIHLNSVVAGLLTEPLARPKVSKSAARRVADGHNNDSIAPRRIKHFGRNGPKFNPRSQKKLGGDRFPA
jgi:hypothetical protein